LDIGSLKHEQFSRLFARISSLRHGATTMSILIYLLPRRFSIATEQNLLYNFFSMLSTFSCIFGFIRWSLAMTVWT